MLSDRIEEQIKKQNDLQLTHEEKDAIISKLWNYIVKCSPVDETWDDIASKIGIDGDQLYMLKVKYDDV